MRWKGQHVRDEARLRDRLWSATVGQALPEEPIRQPARTAPEKLAGAAGRGTQREGGRDHRRRAPRDHQARGGRHSDGQRIGPRQFARDQDADRHAEGCREKGRCGAAARARAVHRGGRGGDGDLHRKAAAILGGGTSAEKRGGRRIVARTMTAADKFTWSPGLGQHAGDVLHPRAGGRLTLGVFAGWLKEEFEALNSPAFEARGAVTDEWITIFKQLLSQSPASFDGRFYRYSDIRC